MHEQHVLAVIDVHEKENPNVGNVQACRAFWHTPADRWRPRCIGFATSDCQPRPGTREQITILHGAFGKPGPMRKDWAYAALVEYGGKRILFDTGDNPDILAQNAKTKRVDLSKLDFIVMSHRHGDHMGGFPTYAG